MTKRMILPLLFGLVGVMILVSLGTWQLRRLEWKEGVLAAIEVRIDARAEALPDAPNEDADQYLPVVVTGEVGEDFIRVLVSRKFHGAGYLIISPLNLGNRSVLLDRGFIKIDATVPEAPMGEVNITGNLLWPDDTNSSTPNPDMADRLWFSRDLAALSAELGTEPVLVVARETSFDDTPVSPLPVDTVGIPNDHLQYAITWFSLAAVWLGMTMFLLWRIRQKTE
ncbi:SURF1 family protein [Actibacterium pelagium]|uniref:SURF1-like protein n=1 Tax=Actibacterium pelagium TaxID=2029103 RepID=A0A917EL46_9RHOB|nr:SURF1 family protein [Actibacterium pelagium]GGE50617.1 SURF1-like protein [Actibacterium pelagium]